MKLVLVVTLTVLIANFTDSVPVRFKRAFSYIANETACTVDHIVYKDGDPIPTDDPCETCRCRPPGFSCVLRECEVKTGCRAIRRIGECCPLYQCGCEHDGKYYKDGERIPNAESPCYSCYCQGSAITCSLADCKFRFDCEPEYIINECCPRYDHCPPEFDVNYVTVPSTEIPRLTSEYFNQTERSTILPPTLRPSMMATVPETKPEVATDKPTDIAAPLTTTTVANEAKTEPPVTEMKVEVTTPLNLEISTERVSEPIPTENLPKELPTESLSKEAPGESSTESASVIPTEKNTPEESSTEENISKEVPTEKSIPEEVSTEKNIQQVPTSKSILEEISTEKVILEEVPIEKIVPNEDPTEKSIQVEVSSEKMIPTEKSIPVKVPAKVFPKESFVEYSSEEEENLSKENPTESSLSETVPMDLEAVESLPEVIPTEPSNLESSTMNVEDPKEIISERKNEAKLVETSTSPPPATSFTANQTESDLMSSESFSSPTVYFNVTMKPLIVEVVTSLLATETPEEVKTDLPEVETEPPEIKTEPPEVETEEIKIFEPPIIEVKMEASEPHMNVTSIVNPATTESNLEATTSVTE